MKPFLIYLDSAITVAFADSLFEMAVIWHILKLTGSATTVGWIAALIQLPVVLAGPFAGVGNKHERVRLGTSHTDSQRMSSR